MNDFGAIVGAVGGGGALAWAGLMHLRRPSQLRVALDGHSIWPRRATYPLAFVVAAVEVLTGFATLAGLAFGFEEVFRAGLGFAAMIFVAYTVYATWLWRRRPDVPCGCTGDGGPATGATAARAGAFAATVAAALATGGLPSAPSATQVITAVTAGTAWGVIVWCLPAALHVPMPDHGLQRAR